MICVESCQTPRSFKRSSMSRKDICGFFYNEYFCIQEIHPSCIKKISIYNLVTKKQRQKHQGLSKWLYVNLISRMLLTLQDEKQTEWKLAAFGDIITFYFWKTEANKYLFKILVMLRSLVLSQKMFNSLQIHRIKDLLDEYEVIELITLESYISFGFDRILYMAFSPNTGNIAKSLTPKAKDFDIFA